MATYNASNVVAYDASGTPLTIDKISPGGQYYALPGGVVPVNPAYLQAQLASYKDSQANAAHNTLGGVWGDVMTPEQKAAFGSEPIDFEHIQAHLPEMMQNPEFASSFYRALATQQQEDDFLGKWAPAIIGTFASAGMGGMLPGTSAIGATSAAPVTDLATDIGVGGQAALEGVAQSFPIDMSSPTLSATLDSAGNWIPVGNTIGGSVSGGSYLPSDPIKPQSTISSMSPLSNGTGVSGLGTTADQSLNEQLINQVGLGQGSSVNTSLFPGASDAAIAGGAALPSISSVASDGMLGSLGQQMTVESLLTGDTTSGKSFLDTLTKNPKAVNALADALKNFSATPETGLMPAVGSPSLSNAVSSTTHDYPMLTSPMQSSVEKSANDQKQGPDVHIGFIDPTSANNTFLNAGATWNGKLANALRTN